MRTWSSEATARAAPGPYHTEYLPHTIHFMLQRLTSNATPHTPHALHAARAADADSQLQGCMALCITLLAILPVGYQYNSKIPEYTRALLELRLCATFLPIPKTSKLSGFGKAQLSSSLRHSCERDAILPNLMSFYSQYTPKKPHVLN